MAASRRTARARVPSEVRASPSPPGRIFPRNHPVWLLNRREVVAGTWKELRSCPGAGRAGAEPPWAAPILLGMPCSSGAGQIIKAPWVSTSYPLLFSLHIGVCTLVVHFSGSLPLSPSINQPVGAQGRSVGRGIRASGSASDPCRSPAPFLGKCQVEDTLSAWKPP